MIFNESDYSNLTNVTEVLKVADTFTGGMLGFGIWLLLSFGTFFVLSRYDMKSSLIAATFVSLISSLFLSFLSLLDGVFVIVSIALFSIAVVLGFIMKNNPGGA